MKNKTWRIVLSALLVLLTGAAAFCGFAVYRFSQSVEGIAREFSSMEIDGEKGLALADETSLSRFYQILFSQIEQYGNMEETEEALASLATQIFVKTLKDCTVESVSFEEEALIVNVQGVAVPLEELNEQLLIATAAKAGWQYLVRDFTGAASSVFQGSDAIRAQLFGPYINEFLTTLKTEIMEKNPVPVHYRLTLKRKDGQWVVEMDERNASESASQDEAEPDENGQPPVSFEGSLEKVEAEAMEEGQAPPAGSQ